MRVGLIQPQNRPQASKASSWLGRLLARSENSRIANVAAMADERAYLPKVIIVTGPTAVGKTAVGLELAQRLNGEVISADSVQVYRGLDVGSDKLPVSKRQGIVHHLLDIRDPSEEFSAGDFHDLARAAAHDIIQRQKMPIVVGGTGFYLRWFMLGKAQGPKTTAQTEAFVKEAIEQAWQAAARQQGIDELDSAAKWDVAVDLLVQWGDAEAAERIRKERNNFYRLRRALCILHASGGRKLSELDIAEQAAAPYDFRCFFLHRNRLELYDRIAGRVEEMVLTGLLDEAAMLLDQGMLPNSNMATRAIGYRQAMEWLQAARQAQQPVTAKQLEQLVVDIINASHKLVRSQMTWFRDDSVYKWVDMDSHNTASAVMAIEEQLQKDSHEGGCPDDSGRLSDEDQKRLKRLRPHTMTAPAQAVQKILEHVNANLLGTGQCTTCKVLDAVVTKNGGDHVNHDHGAQGSKKQVQQAAAQSQQGHPQQTGAQLQLEPEQQQQQQQKQQQRTDMQGHHSAAGPVGLMTILQEVTEDASAKVSSSRKGPKA